MPNFESSNSTQKTISSYSGDAMDRIIATCDNNSGPSGVITNSQKIQVAFKNNANYEHILITEPSGTYKTTAGCALSSLFFPFETKLGNANGVPGFLSTANSGLRPSNPASGLIVLQDILPYQWDTGQSSYLLDRYVALSGDYNSNVVSSDVSYRNTDRFRDISDVRSIGLRLPMMGIGWGFTIDGIPFPSGNIKNGVNLFKGDYNNGWMVDPKDYIAAPIDFRYDVNRNVWTTYDKNVPRPCFVTQDGGVSGDISTTCSLTYTVKDLNNRILSSGPSNTLASGMSPIWSRPFRGTIKAASVGMYYYNSSNTLVLFQVDEVFAVGSGC